MGLQSINVLLVEIIIDCNLTFATAKVAIFSELKKTENLVNHI